MHFKSLWFYRSKMWLFLLHIFKPKNCDKKKIRQTSKKHMLFLPKNTKKKYWPNFWKPYQKYCFYLFDFVCCSDFCAKSTSSFSAFVFYQLKTKVLRWSYLNKSRGKIYVFLLQVTCSFPQFFVGEQICLTIAVIIFILIEYDLKCH